MTCHIFEIMAENEDKTEIVIDEKDIQVTDTEPVKYKADINSSIAVKVKKLEEEAVRERELEERRSERIRIQQDYLNGMLENVTVSLAATDKERQINDTLEQDVKRRVLSMHGISEDRYEGIERRDQAVFQGAEFAFFFMSIVLLVISGILNGMFTDITLLLCFFTAVEGTLLNHGNRPRPVAYILRILYMLIFPVMLTAFVCYTVVTPEQIRTGVYATLYPTVVTVGVIILAMGVAAYFLYDPYKKDKKQVRRAGRYLKNMSRAADKEVTRIEKKAEMEQRKEEKKRERAERREEKRLAREAKKSGNSGT